MKTSLLRTLILGALSSAAALTASAQLTANFNFDAFADGSTASLFNTPQVSFHQAYYVPFLDGFGDPITGSDHWEIDPINDSLYPVTTENPLNYGSGPAPSGTNALQALWQPVLLSFNTTYNLTSFSFTLDNDNFGFVWDVLFVNAAGGTIARFAIDQSVPGFHFSAGAIDGVAGIVLPSGAFYDDIAIRGLAAVSAVPEPSTWGVLGGLACAGAVWLRRRKRASISQVT